MTTENGSSGSIRVQWGDRTARWSRIEGPSKRPSALSLAVRDDEVPAVTTIGTAVCDDVARLEAPIRLGHTQQAAAPPTIDADDLCGHLDVVHARSVASTYGGAMRVVGGTLGGRRLEAVGASAVRPTSDRAREAIFNMLVSLELPVGATVLDLFSGSGALGIEALSRGAAHATFVDSDAVARRTVTANLTALGITESATVVRADVGGFLAQHGEPIDLAFADPPYRFDGWHDLLDAVDADVLVCESDREIEARPDDQWRTRRVRRYGTPVITILVRHAGASCGR